MVRCFWWCDPHRHKPKHIEPRNTCTGVPFLGMRHEKDDPNGENAAVQQIAAMAVKGGRFSIIEWPISASTGGLVLAPFDPLVA
jgi:hypothetical protein